MFNRSTYKMSAKSQLKKRYFIPFIVQLIVTILFTVFVKVFTLFFKPEVYSRASKGHFDFSLNFDNPSSLLYSIIIVCIISALTLAQKSMYHKMYSSERKMSFSDFLTGLDQWWQAFRGGLWYTLWVYLWSLLFVIPGIVKSYSYSMMFYIMAEYPEIGVMKAMKLSKEITRGYKGELFMLDLSFLGWFLLSAITGGIASLWIYPYYDMTKTNAYHGLKEIAINTHLLTEADFN